MGRYEDLSVITRESLVFRLRCLGFTYDPAIFQRIIQVCPPRFYPDAKDALAALKDRKLAILSNGSSEMLNALVHNFKPSPAAYTLIEAQLGVSPADVLFVSCNPFDVSGAKSFGLQVAWIDHVTPEAMKSELADRERIAPLTIFKMLREQMDILGFVPDYRIRALSDLPKVVSRAES
jgi:2-haloacid dehalogenase